MSEDFHEISEQLRRAQRQKLPRLDPSIFTTLKKIESIAHGLGVEPSVDLPFLTRVVREQAELLDLVRERCELLGKHNILLEEHLAAVTKTLGLHIPEIKLLQRRMRDVEPKEEQ